MLGGAGVGKSTLANSLLGREKDFRNEDGECFEAGNPKSGSGGMTKEACAHQGHFLANETLPEVTVCYPSVPLTYISYPADSY